MAMKKFYLTIAMIMGTTIIATSKDWKCVGNWDANEITLIETADTTYYLAHNSATFDLGNKSEALLLCTDLVKVWNYLTIGDNFNVDNYACQKINNNTLEIKCADNSIIDIKIDVFNDIINKLK